MIMFIIYRMKKTCRDLQKACREVTSFQRIWLDSILPPSCDNNKFVPLYLMLMIRCGEDTGSISS